MVQTMQLIHNLMKEHYIKIKLFIHDKSKKLNKIHLKKTRLRADFQRSRAHVYFTYV